MYAFFMHACGQHLDIQKTSRLDGAQSSSSPDVHTSSQVCLLVILVVQSPDMTAQQQISSHSILFSFSLHLLSLLLKCIVQDYIALSIANIQLRLQWLFLNQHLQSVYYKSPRLSQYISLFKTSEHAIMTPKENAFSFQNPTFIISFLLKTCYYIFLPSFQFTFLYFLSLPSFDYFTFSLKK